VTGISLASIHSTYNRGMACISLACHAPLISNYSSTSKCLLKCTYDIALERYRNFDVLKLTAEMEVTHTSEDTGGKNAIASIAIVFVYLKEDFYTKNKNVAGK